MTMALTDPDMVPIPLRELIAGVKIPVDLYVKLGDNKYIVIAKAGTYTQVDRFLSFENKRIEMLYVRKTDYRLFVAQSVRVATTVLTDTDLPESAKATLLSQAASSVLAEIKDLGVSVESYEHAKKVAEGTLQMVEQDFNLLALVKSLSEGSHVFDHSVAVSVLSVMIAKSQGWVKRMTWEKIALGGLLHDIGKKELPPELMTKPRARMNHAEIALYETHPYRGLELLSSITIVPDDVAAIVLEHHENAIGQGYPRRLKDVRLNPLSRVVSLANTFVDLTLPSGDQKRFTSEEALNHIEVIMGQPFNKDAFRALKSIVQKSKAKNAS